MILSAALFAVAASSSGQWVGVVSGNNFSSPMGAYFDTVFQGQQAMWELKQAQARERAKREGSAPSAAPPPPAKVKHQPIEATDFKAGPRIVPAQWAKDEPEARRPQVEALYLKALDQYESQVRKNNLAYAMAMLLGMAMQAHRQIQLDDDAGERLALSLNDALAADKRFAAGSAKQKQEIYERCILTGIFLANTITSKDEAMRGRGREVAGKVLEPLGLQ